MSPARRSPSPPSPSSRAGLARGVFGGIALLCACGGEDAGEKGYAGTIRAEGPAKAYSFRYLSPPWAAVPTSSGVYAVLDWEAALNFDITRLPTLESLPIVLRVEAVTGSAEGALQTRTAALSPPVPFSSTTALLTVSGVNGREVTWTDASANPPVYWREGYFDGSALGGKTFRMQFRGKRSLAGDPLIQAMLASFASGTGNQ